MEYADTVEALNKWAEAYAAGHPIVDDSEYDSKYREIKQFEMEHPSFILDDSPTRHVIDGAEGFRKVEHKIPMISIANSNGIDEADEWVHSMFDHYGVSKFMLEYKLDGGGLALIYNDGVLVDAVTRGKDNVGDSIWENALQIQNVPHNIDLKGEFEVRGEVLWNFDDFDAFNDSMEEQGKKTLANPRNGATGTMKLHDPNEVGRRKLNFVAYHVVRGGSDLTQSEDIELLERLGFVVPEHRLVDVSDFRKEAEEMRALRYDLAYPIDGIVIKVNSKEMQQEIGYTVKSPNFFRAYKFPPEELETELINIEASAGMSGAITPVAIVKPIRLAMTTVQRCSVHNWDVVEYLGLHRGCHVVIRKAGEIIPEIVKCVETGRTKEDYSIYLTQHPNEVPPRYVVDDAFLRPTKCPYCGHELHNAVNGEGKRMVAWLCGNEDCEAQVVGKLVNFCSREAMNIQGMGESTIQALVDAGKIRNFHDIYDITVADLVGIGNIREKRAKQLIAAIERSKGNYLHQLLVGLSIPGIGAQGAQCIATGYQSLQFMVDTFLPGGSIVHTVNCLGVPYADAIRCSDWIFAHLDVFRELCKRNVAMEAKQDKFVSVKLDGYNCIMTGVFDKLPRDVFKQIVKENCGKLSNGINHRTNLVLLGDNAGPKKVKAIEELKKSGKKIRIFTPDTLDQFFEFIKPDAEK